MLNIITALLFLGWITNVQCTPFVVITGTAVLGQYYTMPPVTSNKYAYIGIPALINSGEFIKLPHYRR